MAAPMTIAAVQPPCVPQDLPANARTHADAVRAAGARIVVFPELSLIGYELDAEPVAPGDEALAPLIAACAATGSLALAGALVPDQGGKACIATLCVTGSGADVAYRKTFLGEQESNRCSPGDGPRVLDVDGWRVGLGICKDTGSDAHVRETAALGVDLYVAGLVHRHDERDEQDRRGVAIAAACEAHVAFASFAGRTGGGYERTAGASTIWSPRGDVLARAGTEPGETARATIRRRRASPGS